MSAATVLGSGQVNGAGATDALFLKVFSGEVLEAFFAKNISRDMHMVRTIASGKSAQFPATWKVTSALHTPGAELLGQAVNHNEVVVTIDGVLKADVFIPEIDEWMNHYEIRAPYSRAIGESIAEVWDEQTFMSIVLAARESTPTITGGDGGTVLTDAGFANQGNVLAAGVFEAAENLDDHHVPTENRYGVFPNAQYYLMAQTTNVINMDWGGRGSYADGTVASIAGIPLFKSTNTPTTDQSSYAVAKYQGNFSTTTGCVFHETAAASVVLRDVQTRVVPRPENIGTLVYGMLAYGGDHLRPESAVEFKTS